LTIETSIVPAVVVVVVVAAAVAGKMPDELRSCAPATALAAVAAAEAVVKSYEPGSHALARLIDEYLLQWTDVVTIGG
jgi:hypothetical protein